eukprot:6351455-Ditylum_brightwellii.AAC.1
MKGDKEKKTTSTTRSLVVAGGDKDKDNGIEQLLLFNNLSQEEKDLYPYTGKKFVPFHPTDTDLPPADEQDTSMERVDHPTAMLIVWILRKRASDRPNQ